VAGRSHLAVHDGPDFLGQVLGELTRVGDDDDTTLEGLQGLGQGTERVTVKVVGRLVQDDHVRTLPRAGGQDDLDTLTTGQTAHAGVRHEFGVETEVGAVSLDLPADQRAELAASKSLLLVDLGNHLGMGLDDLAARNPGVVGSRHGGPLLVLLADVLTESERTLVFVGVLELATGMDTDDLTQGTFDLVDLVHSLLVILGDLLVGTVHGLTVLAGLETPLDVLGRSLVEVVIDVGERVLLDVGDTDVLVVVDLTGSGDQLSGQDVDQSGLTSTVGTDDSDTGAQRDLESDVGELRLGGTWVLEGHVRDANDGLGLGLDTLQVTGLGELELQVGGTQLVVGASRRNLLDELAQRATVALKLEALVVDDVLDDLVEELAVVGDDDGSARRVDEVVLQPLNVLDVQVVGGLIKEQNVGVLEDSTGKSQLHPPTTRQGGDGGVELLLNEAELLQLGFDGGAVDINASLTQLLQGPFHDGLLGVGRVQVVLDEDGLDFALLGEALDLLVVNGTHECGLAGTVGTQETVALTTLETEVSLVKKDLGTVSQVEGAVAEILALLLIREDLLLVGSAGRRLLTEGLSDRLGLGLADDGGDVWQGVLSPARDLVVLLVDELAANGGDVLDGGLELGNQVLELGLQNLLEDRRDGGDVTGVGDLGDLAILDITDTDESVQGLSGLLTGLGVGQSLVVLLQSRHQLGQEGSDDLRVLDELAHVVDNDGRLTLDGSLTLDETTVQQRNHDGQSGLVDVLDESGGAQQVDGLRDVLRLGDTLDELGDEALNILVGDQLADLLHGAVGSLLDFGLGVPHGLGDDRDQVGDTVGELDGSGLDQGVDAVESGHLLLPLLGVGEGVDDRRENGLDGVGVGGLDESNGSSLGRVLHGDHLVADRGQDRAEQLDEVRLEAGSDGGVLSNRPDGIQGAFTSGSILLVSELLLERLDSPVTEEVSTICTALCCGRTLRP